MVGFAYKRSNYFEQIYLKLSTNEKQLVEKTIKEVVEPVSVNTFQPAQYKWKDTYYRTIGNNEGYIGWKEEELGEKLFTDITNSDVVSKMEKL
jgi:hypothetical protein